MISDRAGELRCGRITKPAPRWRTSPVSSGGFGGSVGIDAERLKLCVRSQFQATRNFPIGSGVQGHDRGSSRPCVSL